MPACAAPDYRDRFPRLRFVLDDFLPRVVFDADALRRLLALVDGSTTSPPELAAATASCSEMRPPRARNRIFRRDVPPLLCCRVLRSIPKAAGSWTSPQRQSEVIGRFVRRGSHASDPPPTHHSSFTHPYIAPPSNTARFRS